MNFIKLERTISRDFRVSFIGDEIELLNYLNIVQLDKLIHFNFVTKQWELSAKDLTAFVESHPDKNISIEYNTPRIRELHKELEHIGSTMKLTPYMYQKEAIKFALDKKNALIILPCGSGNKN